MILLNMTPQEKNTIIRSLETSYMVAEQTGNRRKKLRIGRLIDKIKYGNI